MTHTADQRTKWQTKSKVFKNILNEYQHMFSDVHAAFKKWPNPGKMGLFMAPNEIKNSVLKSCSVQDVIFEIHKESGKSCEEIENEGLDIIKKLGHDFQPSSYRSLLFIVLKAFKNLFAEINIDNEGIQNLLTLIKNHKVVLLPSHRSYIDFLLISTILFLKDIPIPVVATAEDFLNMAVFGYAMRRTGAFFIRRGVSSNNKLYWIILTEFVQHVVLHGHHPLSFYIEGTRSRTGKSLQPKIGMLRMALELYVKRHISDLLIVPIAISYDRTVEENLFAHELLGIPKPKESTLKLFSALSILKENYGSIFVSVGTPLSVHEFWRHRSSHQQTIIPRQIQTMVQQEVTVVKDLASWIVKKNLNHLVIFPFCIAAFVYTTYLQRRIANVKLSDLMRDYTWIKKYLQEMGFFLSCKDDSSSRDDLFQAMNLHRNILHVEDEEIKLVMSQSGSLSHILPQNLASEAVPSMIILYYANQVLQLLVTPCLIMFVSASCRILETDVADLSELLCRDFVFVPEIFHQEFQTSMNILHHERIIDISNGKVAVLDSERAKMLSLVVLPLVVIRKLICNACKLTSDFNAVLDFCLKSGRLLIENGFVDYRLVSKEMILNAISSLVDCKIIIQTNRISKDLRPGENFITADDKLATLLKYHQGVNSILQSSSSIHLQSKL